jgi:hypothetical protein
MPANSRWDLIQGLKGYCMNLKEIGKVFTSKFVGTGPSSYKKKNLPGRGLTKVEKHCSKPFHMLWNMGVF